MLRRWEGLETWQQVVIAGPLLIVLMAVLNLGPMQQPWERAVVYGLIEGVPLTALLAVATRHERAKRAARGKTPPDDEHDRD
jgi:hypothetical protein